MHRGRVVQVTLERHHLPPARGSSRRARARDAAPGPRRRQHGQPRQCPGGEDRDAPAGGGAVEEAGAAPRLEPRAPALPARLRALQPRAPWWRSVTSASPPTTPSRSCASKRRWASTSTGRSKRPSTAPPGCGSSTISTSPPSSSSSQRRSSLPVPALTRPSCLLRNTVLATWLIALPVWPLFPVAPPRLADIGLVDTITSQTGLALDSKLTTSLYNRYAAVPSLHAGFALAVSAALAAAARRPAREGRRRGCGARSYASRSSPPATTSWPTSPPAPRSPSPATQSAVRSRASATWTRPPCAGHRSLQADALGR